MSTYDWSQFHVRMYYLAPLEEVFRYFSTGAGLEEFFIKTALNTSQGGNARRPDEPVQTGDTYAWKYELVEPNKLIRFTFGTMMVDIHFREVDGSTEVDLHQMKCATTDHDHPNWNDSISIGDTTPRALQGLRTLTRLARTEP